MWRTLLILYLCLTFVAQGRAADEALERRVPHAPIAEGCIKAEPQGHISEGVAARASSSVLCPRLYRHGVVNTDASRVEKMAWPASPVMRLASSKVQRVRRVFGPCQPEDWGLCGALLPRADG